MKVQKTALAAAVVLGALLLAGCGLVPANPSALQPVTDPSTAPAADSSTPQTPPASPADPAQQPAGSHHTDTHHDAAASGGTIGTAAVALSEQDAVSIALQHARVAQSDAMFLQVEGDRDDGRFLYEVEFYVGPVEYKYEIDANTGDILEFETEKD